MVQGRPKLGDVNVRVVERTPATIGQQAVQHRDGRGVRIVDAVEDGRELDQLCADLRNPVVQEWLAGAPKRMARRRAVCRPTQPPRKDAGATSAQPDHLTTPEPRECAVRQLVRRDTAAPPISTTAPAPAPISTQSGDPSVC